MIGDIFCLENLEKLGLSPSPHGESRSFSYTFNLYRVSEIKLSESAKKQGFPCFNLYRNGAGEGTRTPDLLITNQLHYHCATPA
jgi:hypothetical protein